MYMYPPYTANKFQVYVPKAITWQEAEPPRMKARKFKVYVQQVWLTVSRTVPIPLAWLGFISGLRSSLHYLPYL